MATRSPARRLAAVEKIPDPVRRFNSAARVHHDAIDWRLVVRHAVDQAAADANAAGLSVSGVMAITELPRRQAHDLIVRGRALDARPQLDLLDRHTDPTARLRAAWKLLVAADDLVDRSRRVMAIAAADANDQRTLTQQDVADRLGLTRPAGQKLITSGRTMRSDPTAHFNRRLGRNRRLVAKA